MTNLFGYGWIELSVAQKRELYELHKDNMPENLRAVAKAVLLGEDSDFSYSQVSSARRWLRDNASPADVGVEKIELREFDEDATYFSRDAAKVLGISKPTLDHFMQRVKNGSVQGVKLPQRSQTGRAKKGRGWYLWMADDIRKWHQAILDGLFDSFKSGSDDD